MKVRQGCPRFSGRREEYETWRMKVEDWMLITEGEVRYPGVVMRMALEGKALDIAMGMDRDELKKTSGGGILLDKLDGVYRKDKVMETYSKVRSYLKIERGEKETIEEYLFRYDKVAEECKKATGGRGMMEGEVKGCHLLEQAKVTETQKQMVLAACGGDKLDYNLVSKMMKRIFEGLVEKETKEDGWWERKDNKGGTYYKEGRKGRGGQQWQRTWCVICRTGGHSTRDCPKHYLNRGGGKERKEEEKEVVFAVELQDNDDDWDGVEGILDTGCNTTLCGEL